MNVLEDPTGLAQLQKLGLRTVPVLSRGDKYVLGQNTQQIIDFLGLTKTADRSSPPKSSPSASTSS